MYYTGAKEPELADFYLVLYLCLVLCAVCCVLCAACCCAFAAVRCLCATWDASHDGSSHGMQPFVIRALASITTIMGTTCSGRSRDSTDRAERESRGTATWSRHTYMAVTVESGADFQYAVFCCGSLPARDLGCSPSSSRPSSRLPP